MKKISEDKIFIIVIISIFLIALVVRLSIINIRPLHHDEGVAAISFAKQIYDNNEYLYNPKASYHGPFLYYTEAFSFHLFGINEFALRFFGILFSALLVLLIYPLRRYIGDVGALSAALFIAFSSIFVHYSTYSSSHELPFLFFELALIASFFLFYTSKQKKYLYTGFISLGLFFTTKETAYAAMFLLFLFVLATAVLTKTKKTYIASLKQNISHIFSILSEYRRAILISAFITFFIFAMFFTSFFKYPNNLIPTITDTLPSMLSFSEQFKGHEKPFFYYTELLVQYEIPLIGFSLIGLLYFRKNLFSKFWSYLFISTWLLFSFVPYKTPWNTLHIMLPMALVAGIGVQELYKKLGKYFVPIFAIAIIYMAWISYNVNYIDHSGQFNQLAYVTTTPELVEMVNRIYTFNKSAEIKVLSPEQWPLAWYLRDYKRVGYYGYIINESDADVVIVKREDKEKLQGNLTGTYESYDYQLRWGVWLSAFYKNNT